MWHVEPGSGFLMEPSVASLRQMPAIESYLAQLAYDAGLDVRYPGLVARAAVRALPIARVVLLATLGSIRARVE